MFNDKFVITIGRQFGSGGKEIGELLAKKLEIKCYDKELLALAAKESGLCQEFFEKADEHTSKNFIGGLFGTRFPFYNDGTMPLGNCLSNESLFKIQSDVIRHIAENESAVFIGRCADYVLRGFERRVSVFISAPEQERAQTVIDREFVPIDEAFDLINKADKHRSEYYNYYSFNKWGAAESYDMCIDSSILGIDGTAEFIKSFAILKLTM